MSKLAAAGSRGSLEPAPGPTAEERATQQIVFPFIGGHCLPSTGQDPQPLYANLAQCLIRPASLPSSTISGALEAIPFAESPEPQQMVVWLLNHSALSGDQISRVLGVSRRVIYTWAKGRCVNGANLEQLVKVYQRVSEIPAVTTDTRHRLLFAPRCRQCSLFDELAANARKAAPPSVQFLSLNLSAPPTNYNTLVAQAEHRGIGHTRHHPKRSSPPQVGVWRKAMNARLWTDRPRPARY